MSGVDSRSSPLRTCVGCRQRAPQLDLIRVVAEGGVIKPDLQRRMPGRGAYVHPTEQCLERAVSRRAFARALRVGDPLDPEPVRRQILHQQDGPGTRPASTGPASAGADRE